MGCGSSVSQAEKPKEDAAPETNNSKARDVKPQEQNTNVSPAPAPAERSSFSSSSSSSSSSTATPQKQQQQQQQQQQQNSNKASSPSSTGQEEHHVGGWGKLDHHHHHHHHHEGSSPAGGSKKQANKNSSPTESQPQHHASDSLPRCIDKYVNETGGVACETSAHSLTPGVALMFVPNAEAGVRKSCLAFTYYDKKTDRLYALEFPDEPSLREFKDKSNKLENASWKDFVKSIASDMIKNKTKFDVGYDLVTMHVSVSCSKDESSSSSSSSAASSSPTTKSVSLKLEEVKSLNWAQKYRLFAEPSIRIAQARRQDASRKEKERKMEEISVTILHSEKHRHAISFKMEGAVARTKARRQEVDSICRNTTSLNAQVWSKERRYYRLNTQWLMRDLDQLYEKGGQYPTLPLHLNRSVPHVSIVKLPTQGIIKTIERVAREFVLQQQQQQQQQQAEKKVEKAEKEKGLGGGSGTISWRSHLHKQQSSSSAAEYKNNEEREIIEGILRVLSHIDEWGFDVFELEKVSGGNALFCVTLALLLKLDLVSQLNIDLTKLTRYLAHIQAGYHPNWYHNSTHAADVTQVNYYILTKGGLLDKVKLSTEELFATILSGAIHDYDHPGINNSFHTRTNAYLSTLYNERSVLENHHLACAFELMRRPEFDILSGLPYERRAKIRESMIEIVLATDMSNHQKIFDQFRTKMNEVSDWSATKEDKFVGLQIAIKMADVSNTCRPRNLYLPWVQNLTQEFYAQGDHEKDLGCPISPFMDRDKHGELPRGQISFINYVIMPMFEAGANFLPNMKFCCDVCKSNKEYWKEVDVQSAATSAASM